MRFTKERGTAIIVSLFLVALVAAIAVTMMARLNRDIRRTQLLLQSTQATLYAEASVEWAVDTLRYHWLNQKKNELIDVLPLSSPVDLNQNFKIYSTIEDAQGLFNLNNLTQEEWLPYFQRLLLIVEPELSAEKAQSIAKSTLNWISPVSRDPLEDEYYTKLPQPYRAAHRPMASATEFRLIKGVTPALYQHLLPFIIALPENTLINVNTAPPPLLQCLGTSLSAEAAKSLINLRKVTPFLSVEQFSNLDLVRNNAVPGTMIAVSSQYFLIKTQVEKNEQHLLLTTLLHRIAQPNKAVIQILSQMKGGI